MEKGDKRAVLAMIQESFEGLRRALAVLEAREDESVLTDTATSAERIERLLGEINGRSMSVAEIARALDMLPGSVRVALYQNKETFVRDRLSARRVRWRLKSAPASLVRAGEVVCLA